MKKILIKEDFDLPGEDLVLEPGDQIFIPENPTELDVLENERLYDDEEDVVDMMYDTEDDFVEPEDEILFDNYQEKVEKEPKKEKEEKLDESAIDRGIAFISKGLDILLGTGRGRIPVLLARTLYSTIHDQVASEYNDFKVKTFDKTMRKTAIEYITDNPQSSEILDA